MVTNIQQTIKQVLQDFYDVSENEPPKLITVEFEDLELISEAITDALKKGK